MSGKPIEELQLGLMASLTKTYSEWDIYTFAALTGDLNPAHVDQSYAKTTLFREKIAHGMLTASLLSAVLGIKLPGPGSIYISQDLKFMRPVRIGDTITATAEVVEVVKDRNLVKLKTTCTNQKGELVLDGTAVVMPPKVTPPESGEEGVGPEGNPDSLTDAVVSSWTKERFLVGGLMRRQPVTILAEDTLLHARTLLHQHRIRHLPVVEGETLRGIITDRDIRQASLPAPPRRPSQETEALLSLIKVGEVMNRSVISTSPDTAIGEAARLLVSHKIGALPVLEGGRLVGIITETDLLQSLVEIIGI